MRAEGSVLRAGHADTVGAVRGRGGCVDGEVAGWGGGGSRSVGVAIADFGGVGDVVVGVGGDDVGVGGVWIGEWLTGGSGGGGGRDMKTPYTRVQSVTVELHITRVPWGDTRSCLPVRRPRSAIDGSEAESGERSVGHQNRGRRRFW